MQNASLFSLLVGLLGVNLRLWKKIHPVKIHANQGLSWGGVGSALRKSLMPMQDFFFGQRD